MSDQTLRVINDTEEFFQLKKQWNALLQQSYSDTVFLTWEWMYSWWECFQENKALHIVVIEDEGSIIGIAPFCVSQSSYFGLRSLRHLEFLGTTGVCTEYTDFILAPGREQELTRAILDHLFQPSFQKWDVLNLVSMKQDCQNVRHIKDYCDQRGLGYWQYASRVSPYIDLPGTMDDYLKTLDGKNRYKFRHYNKRICSECTVVFVEASSSDMLERDFASFLELHRERWEIKDGNESFRNDRKKYLDFHQAIVRKFHDNNWLFLVFVKANDAIIAAQYDYFYAGKIYCQSVSFNPDWAQYRPGSVMQFMTLEAAINDKKAVEFDFLCGNEEYKYYWTKKERVSVDIAVWRTPAIRRRVFFERKLRKIAKMLFPRKIVDAVYHKTVTRDA